MDNQIIKSDESLANEKEILTQALELLKELCGNNKKLQQLTEIQNEIKTLQADHDRSLPWFEKFIKTISNIKYIFIKSESQLAKETVTQNDDILKRIDNTIHFIAEKSAPLKEILQKEIRKNFDELAKKDLSEKQQLRLQQLFSSYSTKPEISSPLTIVKSLNITEAAPLKNQLIALNSIQQNITNLLKENSNILEFLEIKKQVVEIRKEIPYTFFEKLNISWQKIKDIFIKNNEKVLEENKQINNKLIKKINLGLDKVGKNFTILEQNEQNEIGNELEKLAVTEKYANVINDLKSRLDNFSNRNVELTKSLSQNNLLLQETPDDLIESQKKYKVEKPSSEPQNLIPPPPPLPSLQKKPDNSLSQENKEVEASSSQQQNIIPTPPPPATQNTSNLLDEIRKGLNLKSVKDRVLAPKPQSDKAAITAAVQKRHMAVSGHDDTTLDQTTSDKGNSSNILESLKNIVPQIRNQSNSISSGGNGVDDNEWDESTKVNNNSVPQASLPSTSQNTTDTLLSSINTQNEQEVPEKVTTKPELPTSPKTKIPPKSENIPEPQFSSVIRKNLPKDSFRGR